MRPTAVCSCRRTRQLGIRTCSGCASLGPERPVRQILCRSRHLSGEFLRQVDWLPVTRPGAPTARTSPRPPRHGTTETLTTRPARHSCRSSSQRCAARSSRLLSRPSAFARSASTRGTNAAMQSYDSVRSALAHQTYDVADSLRGQPAQGVRTHVDPRDARGGTGSGRLDFGARITSS